MQQLFELLDPTGEKYALEQTADKCATCEDCDLTHPVAYWDCLEPFEVYVQFDGVVGKIPLNVSTLNFAPEGSDSSKCGINIEGRDDIDYWSFGYPWFHKRYVDFNADANTVGSATLRDDVLTVT